jgi:hypothetical protein
VLAGGLINIILEEEGEEKVISKSMHGCRSTVLVSWLFTIKVEESGDPAVKPIMLASQLKRIKSTKLPSTTMSRL